MPGRRYYVQLGLSAMTDTGEITIVATSPCTGAERPPDCNGNGLPDDCDVAAGAEDVNGNIVPDECELLGDCDLDDVVDVDDAAGFAECLTGPGPFPLYLPPECRCVELSGDYYLDLRDVADFCRRFGNTR
jgi:hypothetical protein